MPGYLKQSASIDRPVIEYPVPVKMPKRIRWIRRIVVIAGLSSFVSLLGAAHVINTLIGGLAELEGGLREKFTGLNDPENSMAIGTDTLTIAKHFTLMLSLLLSFFFLYFPFRYIQLCRRIPKAHPSTYNAIRNVAIIQIVVEILKIATFTAANAETTVLKFPAAASPALLLSIAVLWMITRPASKNFFYRPVLVPVVEDT